LPGDSLLVICGIFAATVGGDGQPLLSLGLLLTAVPVCAVLGDQVGFALGRWLGQGIYKLKPMSLLGLPLYKPSYLKRTEDFMQRWGVFSVVAGRWVPIVRTFAPIVAGVTRMPYKRFVPFNIIGAVTWVWSVVFAGYFLPPVLAKIWPNFNLAEHIDFIAAVVVLLSVLPIVYTVWKEKQAKGTKKTKITAKKKAVKKGRK
jgi:membrane-associated protein